MSSIRRGKGKCWNWIETTLKSLLFTLKGTGALIDFIQKTRVANRRWLLQGVRENDVNDTWGWGSLQEVKEMNEEEII